MNLGDGFLEHLNNVPAAAMERLSLPASTGQSLERHESRKTFALRPPPIIPEAGQDVGRLNLATVRIDFPAVSEPLARSLERQPKRFRFRLV